MSHFEPNEYIRYDLLEKNIDIVRKRYGCGGWDGGAVETATGLFVLLAPFRQHRRCLAMDGR